MLRYCDDSRFLKSEGDRITISVYSTKRAHQWMRRAPIYAQGKIVHLTSHQVSLQGCILRSVGNLYIKPFDLSKHFHRFSFFKYLSSIIRAYATYRVILRFYSGSIPMNIFLFFPVCYPVFE